MLASPKSELLQLHLQNQDSLDPSSEATRAHKTEEAELKTQGSGNYNRNYDAPTYTELPSLPLRRKNMSIISEIKGKCSKARTLKIPNSVVHKKKKKKYDLAARQLEVLDKPNP